MCNCRFRKCTCKDLYEEGTILTETARKRDFQVREDVRNGMFKNATYSEAYNRQLEREHIKNAQMHNHF